MGGGGGGSRSSSSDCGDGGDGDSSAYSRCSSAVKRLMAGGWDLTDSVWHWPMERGTGSGGQYIYYLYRVSLYLYISIYIIHIICIYRRYSIYTDPSLRLQVTPEHARGYNQTTTRSHTSTITRYTRPPHKHARGVRSSGHRVALAHERRRADMPVRYHQSTWAGSWLVGPLLSNDKSRTPGSSHTTQRVQSVTTPTWMATREEQKPVDVSEGSVAVGATAPPSGQHQQQEPQ